MKTSELKSLFFSKLKKGKRNECWTLIGSKDNSYGYFNGLPAHRVAIELHHEKRIPNRLIVCHKCDNPPCCNPKHLFIGTHQLNKLDAFLKGRGGMMTVRPRFGETKTSHKKRVKEYRIKQMEINKPEVSLDFYKTDMGKLFLKKIAKYQPKKLATTGTTKKRR